MFLPNKIRQKEAGNPARFLDRPLQKDGRGFMHRVRIPLRCAGFLVGFWVLFLCVADKIRGMETSLFPQGISFVFLLFFLCLRLIERWNGSSDQPRSSTDEKKPLRARLGPLFQETELGTLLLAAVYVMVGTSGGTGSPLFPLVYLLLFLLSGYTSWQCGVYLMLLASAVELGSYGFHETRPFTPFDLTIRVALLWISGALYRILLLGETLRRRGQFRRKVEGHLEKIHRDAHIFRLDALDMDASHRGTLPEEQKQRTIASVHAVRQGLENLLQMSTLAFSPPLHSLLLFFADEDYFTLRMAVSSSRSLVKGPIPRGRGILGRVEEKKEPVFLDAPPQKRSETPYYRSFEKSSKTAVFPILWEEELIGILVADRREKAAFSGVETEALATLTEEIARVMEFERLFMDLQKKKHAYEKFHRVAHAFNQTRHVEDVALTAMAAAQEMSGAPFSAFTIRHEDSRDDFIVAARWNDQNVESLCGRKLLPHGGLVSQAMKRGCPLPETTALRPQQVLFDSSIPAVELTGAKVFPLIGSRQALGTLVVGDTTPNFLSTDTQRMTEVIADHAALALAQAIINEKMEQMAVTDGLTGLVNHRYFQIKLEEALHRARRYKKNVSLLILDLDRFKRINDTYGHPVGDGILRAVGDTLLHMSRQTDVVARYGGEEFAVIMEETDMKGAVQAAKRIRETIENQAFESTAGSLRCTVSIGLAGYPEHAREKTSLVTLADKALYRAKNSGRNRVVVHGGDVSSGSAASALP